MSRGKQSIGNGVWYICGKYKRTPKRKTKTKQKGGAIPFGLIASPAGSILGEVVKPIFGKILGRGRRRRKRIKTW